MNIEEWMNMATVMWLGSWFFMGCAFLSIQQLVDSSGENRDWTRAFVGCCLIALAFRAVYWVEVFLARSL